MDGSEKVTYWVEISDYDLETAKAMLQSNRFLYVGFMCHQAVEKSIKAYFVAKNNEDPPYVHNLKILAEKSGLYRQLSEKQLDLIEELMSMNIEARYPTYRELLLRSLTIAKCRQLIIMIIRKTTCKCSMPMHHKNVAALRLFSEERYTKRYHHIAAPRLVKAPGAGIMVERCHNHLFKAAERRYFADII